ncbi:MAG: hypothetical protein H7A46_17940 [Verrucomicrobiales bacterium]|nr:hypothetical protein [Verrucomicrobiales bacterium]
MKHLKFLFLSQLAAVAALCLGCVRAQGLGGSQLADHGLKPGTALELLPSGAVLHLEVHGITSALEGLDGLVKATVPPKLAPPDLRDVLATDHPLLTALGYQAFGEPLSDDLVSQRFGLAAKGTLTLSLYPGDPRRLFILSLPMTDRDTLAGLLSMVLQPTETQVEEIASGKAVRVVPANPEMPTLYLVAGADRLFVCGDRGLAIMLFQTPAAKRLAKDAFLGRVLPTVADQHLVALVDPGLIRTGAMYIDQVRPMLMGMLHEQRVQLLAELGPMEREAMERQFRAQFGVEDLDQMADYLEAAARVTVGRLLDFTTSKLLSFEGLCLTAKLDSRFPELGFHLFSSGFQPETSTAAIPLDEVREALAWLGDEADCFSVTGRKPEAKLCPVMREWIGAIREEFAAQGLDSRFIDLLSETLDGERAAPDLGSEVPWTLTVQAPTVTEPSLADSPSLKYYFNHLVLPVEQPVTLVPGHDPGFLEEHLRERAEVYAHNQALGDQFGRDFAEQDPWLDQLWRVDAVNLDDGVRRITLETGLRTHGGIFGFDQHELVSRRVYNARTVGDYLVYHRGLATPDWLAGLDPSAGGKVAPANARLLDRLPAGVNGIEVHRIVRKLPLAVDWIAALEARIRRDLDQYLVAARSVVAESDDEATMVKALRRLPMPEFLYGLCRGDDGELYALLPGNLVYPRPAVMPLVQKLFAGYAAQSDEVGGTICYTRVRPDEFQASCIVNTEGISALIRETGNAIAEEVLAPDRHEEVSGLLWRPGDRDDRNLDRMLVTNPTWDFLPRPPKKTDAEPHSEIPERSAEAGSAQIDLGAFYNAALTDSWHQGNMEDNTLRDLPEGLQTFNDVQFDVRGIVQLAGRSQVAESRVRFPERVEGIPVGRTATALCFLHGTGWKAPLDTNIGRYQVHYANGAQRNVHIVYGRDVRDWWTDTAEIVGDELQVAWTGENHSSPGGPELRLYQTRWENPMPDQEITSIDFISAMSDSAPFLIAITAE